MADSKKKCRQYNIEYLKYGFIQSPTSITLPMCLICQKVFSNEAMKPSRLQEHLTKVHPNKKNMSLLDFQTLEKKILKQPTLVNMFSTASKQDDDGLRASYNISLLIAKSGKPHTIGEELIIPAINEVLNTVLHKPAFDVIKKIPLSNNTVQRRIDEMAQSVEEILCEYLKTTKFSIQLDESTLSDNEALLLAYVRFVKEEKICQELLFVKNLVTNTKGESIFQTLEEFFKEKEIPMCNILSVATDGAPAMVGRYRGFIAYLKKIIPNILAIHCVIHRQHLVAKNLSERLHESLYYVISAINKIKNNSLNDRLFGKLCTENDEEFNKLLFHTEVRWLSKGACLDRFYKLFDSVLEFLETRDDVLRVNLIKYKSDIAYLTDLFKKFNETNLQLQGDELTLIKTKNIISAFIKKLLMYKINLGRKEFIQFPNLSMVQKNDEDIITYCQHLEALHSDFNKRFEDILKMVIPGWVLDPFSSAEIINSPKLEEELIELSTNEELKFKFKEGYQTFWLQKQIPLLYPGLWAIVQTFLIAFPSSYLVERGFSAVTNLLTKKRQRLQITNRGDLRMLLTKIEPNIHQLLAKHQVHPSH
ncbi:SCAN domain-containing protein 3-like [Daktulosphaira vitifoliae]|uniref:SCAN domain-containing protein 3-like n=1 Tax=Daktulosphaira vitifoliae TaxID=58002 RepID=UPI0021A9BF2A|nr:SCAN domain-containing protein 3-like [Daktulosphaira vitifoliae]XP_050548167.1 SCAN domain-containing protein 3-like [Daktulosphaira vitifoliae]